MKADFEKGFSCNCCKGLCKILDWFSICEASHSVREPSIRIYEFKFFKFELFLLKAKLTNPKTMDAQNKIKMAIKTCNHLSQLRNQEINEKY